VTGNPGPEFVKVAAEAWSPEARIVQAPISES
jgi:hypothetical protein